MPIRPTADRRRNAVDVARLARAQATEDQRGACTVDVAPRHTGFASGRASISGPATLPGGEVSGTRTPRCVIQKRSALRRRSGGSARSDWHRKFTVDARSTSARASESRSAALRPRDARCARRRRRRPASARESAAIRGGADSFDRATRRRWYHPRSKSVRGCAPTASNSARERDNSGRASQPLRKGRDRGHRRETWQPAPRNNCSSTVSSWSSCVMGRQQASPGLSSRPTTRNGPRARRPPVTRRERSMRVVNTRTCTLRRRPSARQWRPRRAFGTQTVIDVDGAQPDVAFGACAAQARPARPVESTPPLKATHNGHQGSPAAALPGVRASHCGRTLAWSLIPRSRRTRRRRQILAARWARSSSRGMADS